jgi:hypothetical protein
MTILQLRNKLEDLIRNGTPPDTEVYVPSTYDYYPCTEITYYKEWMPNRPIVLIESDYQ